MSQDNALTPRSFDGPSNDTEYVNPRKFTGKSTKQPRRKYWSQLHRPKGLRPQFVPVWVDEDFNEMGF